MLYPSKRKEITSSESHPLAHHCAFECYIFQGNLYVFVWIIVEVSSKLALILHQLDHTHLHLVVVGIDCRFLDADVAQIRDGTALSLSGFFFISICSHYCVMISLFFQETSVSPIDLWIWNQQLDASRSSHVPISK